ncbi:MAG: hypothetical protein HFJ28_03240 [Clostridia bacterium]|jgi:tRNA(Phe) wybutosine-synthesizing methylase Tyw3|nr:hypothetical protein [Clostridia bacterium]
MSLIGILTDKSHENYIKEGLKGIVSEEQIIFIKEDMVENLKNIKFETVLIGKEIKKSKEQVRQLAKKAKYLILNTDMAKNLDLLDNLIFELITYGLNSKATITTSSIEDGKIMVCLQRTIQNVKGKSIEPQERSYKEETNGYAVMELISLQFLYT